MAHPFDQGMERSLSTSPSLKRQSTCHVFEKRSQKTPKEIFS